MRRLEHIGIAVKEAGPVVRILQEVLGRRPYKEEVVEAEGVATHFLDAGTTKLELLEARGAASPISGFLEKRGPGVHHLAFEVEDLDFEVDRLRSAGYTVLGTPRPGADGKRIVFLHPRDTGRILVELCQQHAYPEVPGLAEREILVPPGAASDPLAHALSTFYRVRRSGEAALWAAVDPGDAPPAAGRGVCVLRESSRPTQASLIIGIGHPATVSIPVSIWERLPDQWGWLAQVSHAHLGGRPGVSE